MSDSFIIFKIFEISLGKLINLVRTGVNDEHIIRQRAMCSLNK